MTEGTAIQVSPFSFNVEDQMSVRRVFEAAADAVVNASALKTEVAELRRSIDEMRSITASLMYERDEARKERDVAELRNLEQTEELEVQAKALTDLAERVKDRDRIIETKTVEAQELRRKAWHAEDKLGEVEHAVQVQQEAFATLDATNKGLLLDIVHLESLAKEGEAKFNRLEKESTRMRNAIKVIDDALLELDDLPSTEPSIEPVPALPIAF
jgi:chromosome segregation ATPase